MAAKTEKDANTKTCSGKGCDFERGAYSKHTSLTKQENWRGKANLFS